MARKKKTARHPAQAAMRPPKVGAIIGAIIATTFT